MPSIGERRGIEYFVQQYNLSQTPKITKCDADRERESPDALCTLEDGTKIALEHTSAYPPKRAIQHFPTDLSPLRRVLDRKFRHDYRLMGASEAWLILQMRRTLPFERVDEALQDLRIPNTYNRVYIQWPVLYEVRDIRMGLYELGSRDLCYPNQYLVS